MPREKLADGKASRKPRRGQQRIDWRRAFIVTATAAYVIAVVGHLIYGKGIAHLLDLQANNLGDFLAGAFAPLAFLWLIAGFFLQQRELGMQRRQLRMQARELEYQRHEMEKANDLQTNQLELLSQQTSALKAHVDLIEAESATRYDAVFETVARDRLDQGKVRLSLTNVGPPTLATRWGMRVGGNMHSDPDLGPWSTGEIKQIEFDDSQSAVGFSVVMRFVFVRRDGRMRKQEYATSNDPSAKLIPTGPSREFLMSSYNDVVNYLKTQEEEHRDRASAAAPRATTETASQK